MKEALMAAALTLVMSGTVGAQTPVTVMSKIPIDGWNCMPHPYTVFMQQGWLLCVAPSNTPNPPDSTASPNEYVFANAFLGVPGMELTYVKIKNRTPYPASVEVEVTTTDGRVVTKSIALSGGEAPEPEALHGWPELRGVRGGISVTVKGSVPLSVSLAMHPATGDEKEFWQKAKILEGRN